MKRGRPTIVEYRLDGEWTRWVAAGLTPAEAVYEPDEAEYFVMVLRVQYPSMEWRTMEEPHETR